MLSVAQATALRPGAILYHTSARNADKTPLRARVNGKCQTWKTRPDEFSLPMKRGLREHFYITQDDVAYWCLTEDEARNG